MSVTFNREQLLRAVRLAASITPRNTPKVVLHGVRLHFDSKALIVSGTDLEASVSVAVGCEPDTWEALPNAQKLVAVLTECTDEEITLSHDDDSLCIRGQFSEHYLQDIDKPDVFPSSVPADPSTTFTMEVHPFVTSLKRIEPFCARESARYALTGVKIELADGKVTLVATDGKWMATEELPCTTAVADDKTYVVPERVINLLLNSCKGEDGEVTIGLTPNSFTASVDGVTINARLLEGRYPTWREVFPKKYDWKVSLNAGSLRSVTKQAATMMTEDSRGIDYSFEQSKLSAKSSSQSGKAKIELPIAYDEKARSLTIAGDLMSNLLGLWPADTELTMKGVNNNTVSVFQFTDTYSAVIVPLAKAGAA